LTCQKVDGSRSMRPMIAPAVARPTVSSLCRRSFSAERECRRMNQAATTSEPEQFLRIVDQDFLLPRRIGHVSVEQLQ
jgi:hypothetical protein